MKLVRIFRQAVGLLLWLRCGDYFQAGEYCLHETRFILSVEDAACDETAPWLLGLQRELGYNLWAPVCGLGHVCQHL